MQVGFYCADYKKLMKIQTWFLIWLIPG